ncbi:MAG: hypothetical protein J2P57_02415 [Acidimicrobiaceae bacterium]|nr:hypothetical protein [Acidimicrobiaceae bacterium]
MLNVGFVLVVAGVAVGLLSLAVQAIPLPLVVGLIVVGLGCMLGSEVLHLWTLEQYRTTAGDSLTSYYTLVIGRWLRRARSYPPPLPLILGAVVALGAALWSFFWLPPGQAQFGIAGALALIVILVVIGRLLRRW